MKKRLIKCFKIKNSDVQIIQNKLERFPFFELETVHNFDLLIESNQNAIFCYVDETISYEELKRLCECIPSSLLHIVMKNKNFDKLMLCYQYKVASVFEGKVEDALIEKALINLDLYLTTDHAEFPVQAIMELYSSPLKVKSDQKFYGRLVHYFNQFEQVKFFDILSIVDSEKEFVSGAELSESVKNLKLPLIDKKFIGEEYEIILEDKSYLLIPALHTLEKSLWIIIDLAKDERSYILNRFFYKFLENIHIYRINKEKEHNLEVLATTDDVTGLYNQRKLSQDLEAAVEFHEKQHKNFSIMFIDVDHFKSVNDNYGHVVGSKLLQDIGEVLSHILRSSDDIYRYGGDEFVVIMPSVNIKTVHEIATRILTQIKAKKFDIGKGQNYQLSVSIGIAEYPTDATSAIEIIRFADEMMYQSKKSGRGKVFHIKEVQNVDASSE